jgi:hypothetical protein
MKHFFKVVGLIILILGVLAGKIYLDLLERPRYYLDRIGAAITARDLVDFEKWVDLEGIAHGIVSDYFAASAKQPDSSASAALKREIIAALVAQMRAYVKDGQFTSLALLDLSKPARMIVAQLSLTNDAAKQFRILDFVKETGQTASAGLKSTAVNGGGDTMMVKLKLRRIGHGWQVTRVKNYLEIKNRLRQREKQKMVKVEDLLVQGVKNSVLWGKFDHDEAILDLSGSAVAGWPSGLVINRDQQEHLRVWLVGATYKILLPIDPGKAEAFEHDGRLNSHYYVQAGEYDFDGDGRAELVIAIGDNSIDLVVDIFKYVPTPQGSSAAEMGPENWVLVKALMGQNKAYINGRNIRLPYTAVNIETEYRWDKKGFREVR